MIIARTPAVHNASVVEISGYQSKPAAVGEWGWM
jgi:hypothetical protein